MSARRGAETSGSLHAALRLLVLTDAALAGERGILWVVESALRGGCRSIQLRDKISGAREMMEMGQALRRLTREHGALLFVNDRVDVALALDADGAHLGPDDLPVSAVRAVVPRTFLIGYSTDRPDEAVAAVAAGADYIGCGTVHPTAHKADVGESIGPPGLERVARAVDVPVVGIGGIQRGNVADLVPTGAAGVAVMGAVMAADDPEDEARVLLTLLSGATAAS